MQFNIRINYGVVSSQNILDKFVNGWNTFKASSPGTRTSMSMLASGALFFAGFLVSYAEALALIYNIYASDMTQERIDSSWTSIYEILRDNSVENLVRIPQKPAIGGFAANPKKSKD